MEFWLSVKGEKNVRARPSGLLVCKEQKPFVVCSLRTSKQIRWGREKRAPGANTRIDRGYSASGDVDGYGIVRTEQEDWY